MVQVIYNVYLEQEDVVGKTIPGFYGIIAEAIGLSWGDEGLKADCRRMTVSEKIREEIFATKKRLRNLVLSQTLPKAKSAWRG